MSKHYEKMQKHTTIVDVADTPDAAEARVRELLYDTAGVELIRRDGPAGGCPQVRVGMLGSKRMAQFLKDYHGSEDVEWLSTLATPPVPVKYFV